MSLIYIGKLIGEASVKCSIKRLYHRITVNPDGRGTIRFDLILHVSDGEISGLIFALPYNRIDSMQCTNKDFLRTFEEKIYTITTKSNQKVIKIEDIEAELIEVTLEEETKQQLGDFTYISSKISFPTKLKRGIFAFSVEFEIPSIAKNVAKSLFYEATWSLDLTLYGPINPRSHVFLEKEKLEERIVNVESGYSYLYLPPKAYPKFTTPPTLEVFFDEKQDSFLFVWVIGKLRPWFEHRSLVTYSNIPSNAQIGVIIGVSVGVISIVLTILTVIF